MGVLAEETEDVVTTARHAWRKVAVVCAVIGIVAGIGAVVARPAEDTLAAWNDTESAEATVTVEWSNGGFAKNTANSYTNFDSYSNRPGKAEELRSQERSSNNPGKSTDNYGNTSLLGLFQNFSILTPGLRRANRVDVCEQTAAPLSTLGSPSSDCPFPESFLSQTRASTFATKPTIFDPDYGGKGQAGYFANPSPAGNNPILWVEARGITTAAQCGQDRTSKASVPTLAWPNPSGATIGLVTTGTLAPTPGDNEYVQITPQPNKLVSGWVLAPAAAGGYAAWAYYKILMRSFSTIGYALSDITVQVSQYDTASGDLLGTSELILARSECGVSTPSSPRIPIANAWMPRWDVPNKRPDNPSSAPAVVEAPVPDPTTGAVTFPLGFKRSLQNALDRALAPLTGEAATTTTTPSASAIATQTTTSAPPRDPDNPDSSAQQSTPRITKSMTPNESGGTTTAKTTKPTNALTEVPTDPSNTTVSTKESTSNVIPEGRSEATGAAPTTSATTEVPTVPDEAGRMPANAEFCESLEIDGEYVDAFTADECDAAARISAMSALEDYIADGEQDSRWKGFTSDDPGSDGWRWAAIDQRTGHVVYVP